MTSRSRHPLFIDLALAAATVALGMALSLAGQFFTKGWHIDPRGHQAWFVPGDFWFSMKAARYVANGALGYVYEADSHLRALPLFPIVLAPLSAIGDHFHLAEPVPFPIEHPTMWLLAGPAMLATSAVLLISARSLLEALGKAMTIPLRLALLVLVFAVMAWPYGHFEDVLALSLLFFAIRDRHSGKPIRSAFMLGFAIAFKQWAGLAVPFFVLGAAQGLRIRVLLASVALPAALAGFVLAVDYPDAAPTLLLAPSYPGVGHPAIWAANPSGTTASGLFRLGALALSAALAWVSKGRQEPRLWIGALAVALAIRVVLEPVTYAYYLSPAAGMLLVWAGAAGSIRRAAVTGAVATIIFAFNDHGSIWWVGMVLACLLAILPAARDMHASWAREQLATAWRRPR